MSNPVNPSKMTWETSDAGEIYPDSVQFGTQIAGETICLRNRIEPMSSTADGAVDARSRRDYGLRIRSPMRSDNAMDG